LKVFDSHSRFRNLSEAAQRIGDVVKLINVIAAQTNLLALRAEVENFLKSLKAA
jgi:methyl-accepting chemotaxis protein